MSLLICTPVHALAFMPWVRSILKLQESLIISGLKHDFLFIEGESLVERARNNPSTSFLETDFERLIFIDSDIQFEPEHVEKLWNLNEDVCCASYPMKKIGVRSTCWKNGRLVDLDQLDGPTEVDYAATGFLMIKREVFVRFKKVYNHLAHMEGLPDGDFSARRESMNWFDPHVTQGPTPRDRVLLSEDYAFSKRWRDMGGKIILDPSIKLIHHGFYGYG